MPQHRIWPEKDNVLQADTCSCALPHPAHIPQGRAAVLQLREFTQQRCCCPVTVPRQHWSWAGTPGSTWAEPSWQGRQHSPGHPYLGAFSWESPAPWVCWEQPTRAHPCVPGCSAPCPEPWHHILPPADTPSWPGCSRFLCLWSISLPGSCCKQVLLLWSSDL